jgi:hypothetical protein
VSLSNNNAIVLWDSPNGVDIPVSVSEVDQLATYIQNLSSKEISKIASAFNASLYDMATEYTWIRTINILRDKVLAFGKEFVLEMLGRTDSDTENTQDFLSEVDIINLAADLGFISKTAKMHFLHSSEVIKHYSSRDIDEEMDKTVAQGCIKNCVRYVLALTDDGFEFSFNNFREKLKQGYIKNETELFTTLINSPYFYKRTTVRTCLNLSKSTQGAELENVLANMVYIIPEVWEDLLSDDRYPVGFAYSEAVSEGNVKLVKALKSVLLKVKGFDYVPESLRSTTFIDAANELLRLHHGLDNYYNEPAGVKHLLSLGTSIPVPALGVCITATLACKLGNSYGRSNAAQKYLDEILVGISSDRWEYYINQVLPVNETILYKLQESSPARNWNSVVVTYNLDKVNCKNAIVEKLIKAGKENRVNQIFNYAKELCDKIR